MWPPVPPGWIKFVISPQCSLSAVRFSLLHMLDPWHVFIFHINMVCSQAAPARKRIASAVVVEARPEDEEQAGTKRAAEEPVADNATKKRARRMFGALIGTLQRFK